MDTSKEVVCQTFPGVFNHTGTHLSVLNSPGSLALGLTLVGPVNMLIELVLSMVLWSNREIET